MRDRQGKGIAGGRGEVRQGPLCRLRDKRRRGAHWKKLPTADAVVTDQCVLWRQFIFDINLLGGGEDNQQLVSGTVAHFEVEFTDERGRAVRCWTDGTLYLCSQVRRGDHVTVWYVPDDDVSLIRVPRMRARDDEGKESPYAKRSSARRHNGSTKWLEQFEKIPPVSAPDGSDDELWCEPGTFGDVMAHSEWGREYWRCMPTMWYSPWVFGDTANPERYAKADFRCFKNNNPELMEPARLMLTVAIPSLFLVLLLMICLWGKETSSSLCVYASYAVLALVAIVAFLCYAGFQRRKDAKTISAVLSRGHILRRHPCLAGCYPDEVRAHVAEVIRIPLFDDEGGVPLLSWKQRSFKDIYDQTCLRYCGDGWMALVVYPGLHGGERRWAFADPECYESYLADGEEPPVRPGDEVVVRLGREETERNINPWLVHSLRA